MSTWLAGALDRAVRTALQVLAAYLTVANLLADVDWSAALSATALAVVLSALTSVLALPSFGEAWYFQVAERAAKTFVQSLAAFIGTTVMFQDVEWKVGFSAALTAALYSVVTSTMTTRLGSQQAVGQVDLAVPPGPPAHSVVKNTEE